jgi:predicted phage terminase large subunit-like protein
VLEPSTRLDWAWHIQALCDHVQALIEESWKTKDDPRYVPRAQNLAINVPPGTLKSRILSVYAPAWAWVHRPDWKLLALSSNPVVADRDADYSKQVVESNWYQEWFRPNWSIRKERDAIRNFHNTAGGFRISRGLNATVTGLRGDAIFIDDPNDVKDVSDVKLEAVDRNWTAASNRVNDERSAVRVMIQQRTHERDLTGMIFDKGNPDAEGADWEHLVIPMLREIGKKCKACGKVHAASFIGWDDPRKKEGDVLQPERNTPKVVKANRRKLGSIGFAGQMQQRPTPEGGGMFKTKYWGTYDALEMITSTKKSGVLPRPKLSSVIISVDANFKAGGTSRAAIVVIGAKGPKRFVLDAWAKSVSYPDLKRQLKKMIATHWYYTSIIIEDAANGSALISELSGDFRAVIPITPQGGKVVRASAMLPDVEAGDVYLPRHASWREDFVEEHGSFPLGSHDDYVDALSQAMTHLQDMTDLARALALGTM